MKIGKGANKKRSPQHQQQRKRNLGNNQKLTESYAACTSARGAGASLLECRCDVHTRGCNGGSESENNSRGERYPNRESKYAPVEIRVKAEILTAAGQQPKEKMGSRGRNSQAQDASRQRQHQTLCQQLPQYAPAPCAQTQANRYFAPSRIGSGEKQIRNVGTRDSKNNRRHG